MVGPLVLGEDRQASLTGDNKLSGFPMQTVSRKEQSERAIKAIATLSSIILLLFYIFYDFLLQPVSCSLSVCSPSGWLDTSR